MIGRNVFMLKSVGLAGLLLILLYSLASYFLLMGTDSRDKSLNLLDHQPTMVFGTMKNDVIKKALEIQLDEIGVGLLLFSTDGFNTDDYSQLSLGISDLPYNYQVNLIFVKKNKKEPIEIPLLQANNHELNNLLYRNNLWQGEIQQIGLRIMPQNHLGLSISSKNPLLINSAALNNRGYWANYFTLFHYWMDYHPWSYRSINHLHSQQLLPIVVRPIVFIVVWLILCFVIFYHQTLTKITLLLVVVPAWILLDGIFLHNTYSKSQWTNAVYRGDKKLYPDEDLYIIANQVKALLNLNDKTNTKKMRRNKVLVLSTNSYQRFRLIYHLLPVNSSFLDFNAEPTINAKMRVGDYILSYDNNNNPLKPVGNALKFNKVNIKVKTIAKDTNFIIMQVIQ